MNFPTAIYQFFRWNRCLAGRFWRPVKTSFAGKGAPPSASASIYDWKSRRLLHFRPQAHFRTKDFGETPKSSGQKPAPPRRKNFAGCFSVLMAVVLAASGLSIGAEPSDVWLLFSEARVDSSGVFLDQLVQPVQPVVLPHIRLAQAPPLGQAVILSRQQILAIVQTNDPSLVVTNWMGARQVHILRRTRQLDEIEMLRLLTTVLQRDEVKTRGELELHLTLKWTPVTVPDEPLTIKIGEFPANGLSAN